MANSSGKITKQIACIFGRNCFMPQKSQTIGKYSTSVFPKAETTTYDQPTKERTSLPDYRFVYPEFLPDPNPEFRNKLREKLERLDMLRRRAKISIPEFYVGSILAITVADPNSPSKNNRFVGICIDRIGCGLRASCILRNIVDGHGVEIKYELYNPLLKRIEVLRLEKRLDSTLYYLRDALPQYSTFSFDMEPEPRIEGATIPINPLQVELKPRPWYARWERANLMGVKDVNSHITEKMLKQAAIHEKPWEKFDLMKQYRSTIPEDEQVEIFSEVESQLKEQEVTWQNARRQSKFSRKPIKV
ncbi:large ribosomal subunit protein bL19m-like [Artemia franciscana]|uniref:Large ribosomal subunit protein bL19m n=1 Tax=Artemia franciscana TaxID=6661 RepID=A0AA88L2X8_ARTSF|nr:hypothetical protein QYM36_012048 [Artemia franciscana]